MPSKRDRRGSAEFDQESEETIREQGLGGKGLHESLKDAERRGITPELARKAADQAKAQSGDPGTGEAPPERPASKS